MQNSILEYREKEEDEEKDRKMNNKRNHLLVILLPRMGFIVKAGIFYFI